MIEAASSPLLDDSALATSPLLDDWARIPGGPPAAFVRCTMAKKIATKARMVVVVEERGESMMMMMTMKMKEALGILNIGLSARVSTKNYEMSSE